MPRFKVTYSEHILRSIDIEAISAAAAEQAVLGGSADYNESVEEDAEVVSVNSVVML